MVFLHSHGVGTSRAVRIFKTYGHDAIQVMTENPYRLARDIRGIGFRTADAIAMKLGMTREAPQRVRAGISFALQEATDEGHCGLPVEELVKLATTLLEVDDAVVRTALTHELAEGEVVTDTIDDRPCAFLRGLYLAERGIADRLQTLSKGSPPWPRIDIEKAVPWVEKKTSKTLAASQRAAIEMVLRSKATVVTGGPGVGKTTLLDATTIHKSQGSEYPAVVITLVTQHYTMLARNLVYTAVTRGKRLVVIVGQRKALAIAVRTHGSKRRWTKLREWLSARPRLGQ